VGLYFWYYPRLLFRGTNADTLQKDELITSIKTELELPVIRKSKEIFAAAFSLFRMNFWRLAGVAFLAAAMYSGAFWFIFGKEGVADISFTRIAAYNMYQFHKYGIFFWNFFLNIFLISAVSWSALRLFKNKFEHRVSSSFKTGIRLFIKIVVIVTLFELSILSGNIIVASIGILAIPFLAFFMVVSAAENLNLPNAFGRMIKLLSGTGRHIFFTFVTLSLIAVLILFLIDSPLTWFYLDMAQWNLDADDETKMQLALMSLLFVNQLGLGTVIPLIIYGQVLEYFAALETKEAAELETAVDLIGVKRSAYGLERE